MLFLPVATLAFVVALVSAQDNVPEFDIDPYLEYRPAFAKSLPVQILLTGVVFTLVAVLFIHLVFTAQYHWPLAPVNYVLQLSAVTTLLISLIATLQVVLSATFTESEKWPYMLSYIAVNVPPFDRDQDADEWSIAERATWLVMNASTSGLIQITHIQFLTLLYPSRLEGRLIFTLLGPLAIVAAVMQLLPISANDNVVSISSAVRNVCNATLSLMFTVALFLWGLLVNRKQAWRTDGGTAAFGAAALVLAVISTALNFLYVPREEEFIWLPSLMWAVVLWQSFLGWWWWVGAGSGSGLAGDEDMIEKLEKEAKRGLRRKEAKRDNKPKTKKVWKGVAGTFATHASSHRGRPAQPTRRRDSQRSDRPSSPSDSAALNCEISPIPTTSPSMFSASSIGILPASIPAIIQRWYASLRHAHLVAARQQAAERVERIRELERNGTAESTVGWGLGSFGWRIGQDFDRGSSHKELELYPQNGPPSQHQDPYMIDNIPKSMPTARHSRSRSLWWWGPLARWRLQDSTVY